MRKYLLQTGVIIALLFAGQVSVSQAHEGHRHGKPETGTVTAIDGDMLTVKTDGSELKVKVVAETEYTGGHGGQKTDARPKNGDVVMVYGTKLETGELVADEVMIHGQAGTPAH